MLEFIKGFFVSKDKVFFDIFDEVSANNSIMGKELVEMVKADMDMQSSWLEKIQVLEYENKNLIRKLFGELDRNFLAPFDREDMHGLAKSLEMVGHFIYGAAKKINFYKIDSSNHGIQSLTNCIHMSTKALQEAVNELRTLRNIKSIVEACIKVNSAENMADDAYDVAIEDLFEHEEDAKEVIKMREIYQIMELVCDQCESAADVIESIIVKST